MRNLFYLIGFVEVAEYTNGELIVKGSRLPAWIEQLQAFLQPAVMQVWEDDSLEPEF